MGHMSLRNMCNPESSIQKDQNMPSLREVRVTRLLTIRDLAQRASVAVSTVYLIESGRSTPRLSVVRQLASVLEVEPQNVIEFQRAIDASKTHRRQRQT